MAYLTCQNPNCKNHGSSHPNCKCYQSLGANELSSLESQGQEYPGTYTGGRKKMADGGEVSFCSTGKPHMKGCQYYAEGGDALPSFDQTQPVGATPAAQPEATAQAAPSSDLPAFEDTHDIGMPSFDKTVDPEKYSGLGQEILTGIEGAGMALPGGGYLMKEARNVAESVGDMTGINPDRIAPSMEDIAARQAVNPTSAGIGKMVGTFAALKAVPGGPALKAWWARAGVGALKGAVEMGAIQGNDEISKAMLGEKRDPSQIASSIIAAGGLGFLTGGMFSLGGSASKQLLQKFENSRMEQKAIDFLSGVGSASNPTDESVMGEAFRQGNPAFKAGQKFYTEGLSKLANQIADIPISAAGATAGGYAGGVLGAPFTGAVLGERGARALHSKLGAPLEKILGAPLNRVAQKYVPPAVLWALKYGQTCALSQVVNYAKSVASGEAAINGAVENLFKAGAQKSLDFGITDGERTRLKQYIEGGGLNQQMQQQLNEQPPAFAEGGMVDQPKTPQVPSLLAETDPISTLYPEQSQAMMAAKGRAVNYLNSIRPLDNQVRLPFDTQIPNKTQERSYDRAVDIAIQPLTVLQHIEKGTITPEHVKHLNAMYPELGQNLQKKVTEQILQAQMKGEKPSYKIRQGLSMLMGAPMDSSFTPASIQAAQSVYMAASPPQAPTNTPSKAKRGSASLSKVSMAYTTADQARAQRAQKT